MGDTWIVNSVDEFPDWPAYALWCEPYTPTYAGRQPYQQNGYFSCYNSLSMVKAAVTNDAKYTRSAGHPDGTLQRSYRIYERHNNQWIEIYKIEAGTLKKQHELWKRGAAPKQPQAVDEDEVAAAIASITGG